MTASAPSRGEPAIAHDVIAAAPTDSLRARGLALLQASLGPDASFRDGQWEAIEAIVEQRAKLLVVQRTGWGKSSVYFLSTKLLRERGAGPTVLISPLLALMRDQIRAAERLGVRAATINSTNTDEWADIVRAVHDGDVDVLLVSPERLANSAFVDRVLEPLLPSTGLFVVDEAHCISDWGHDFRPDYRRIRQLLTRLRPDTAVLATTATASEAVARDVVHQLGDDVVEQRGPLSRASLQLQAIHLPSEHERMAWLADQLPAIDGSGIVYVLTKAHAKRVAEFLRSQGISAFAYTGGGTPGGPQEREKLDLERQLVANEVKALVATPALGMGFDKPDLAFVVHFQMPQSLIHYYQQVGRAGRAVDDAYGVLLHGDGDQRITDYFIAQAFPPPDAVDAVVRAARRARPMGTTLTELAKRAKVGRALTEKILGQLAVEVDPAVEKRGASWYATGADASYDVAHAEALTQRRHEEYARMQAFARGERCLMVAVADELDDPTAEPCGRCAVCVGRPLLPTTVSPATLEAARGFAPATATRKRRAKRPPKTTARVKRARRRPKS